MTFFLFDIITPLNMTLITEDSSEFDCFAIDEDDGDN